MSSSDHHRRKRRKKNSFGEFFDRLTGRKSRHSNHTSHFPGISLPKDYDPVDWKEKSLSEKEPARMDEPVTELPGKDFTDSRADNLEKYSRETVRPGSSMRKRSLFSRISLYFKNRELRREERLKERLKRMHRKESQEEFRKINAGPGIGKKLFNVTEWGEEADKERKHALLSQRSMFYRNLTIAVNSLLIFLLTYVLVYLFYWLTSMLVASVYGLDSTLYYYDLKFNNHSPLWSRFNVLLVTGVPPFFCLFLGAFLYRVLFKVKRFAGLQKLFILWGSFHLLNHFFGAFPSGIITDEGFGYVAAWMYMNTAFKFLFGLISIFTLGVIGFYSAQHILETSDSLRRIKFENRMSFMLYQIAIPWLIGTIVMLLVRMPHNFDYPYETLMLFTTVFLVIPPFFNEKVKPELNLLKSKKIRTIHMGYLAMMMVMLIFLRIVLGIGLHFIIEINISISPALS